MKVSFRVELNDAQNQLEKGKSWILKTLSPLVDMKGVSHVGFICFPNIENQAVLEEAGLEDTELKVERFICPID